MRRQADGRANTVIHWIDHHDIVAALVRHVEFLRVGHLSHRDRVGSDRNICGHNIRSRINHRNRIVCVIGHVDVRVLSSVDKNRPRARLQGNSVGYGWR